MILIECIEFIENDVPQNKISEHTHFCHTVHLCIMGVIVHGNRCATDHSVQSRTVERCDPLQSTLRDVVGPVLNVL